jgi:hypothetical protein
MKEIKLTQGKVALVDDEDWEFLHLFKWYARRDHRTFYAERAVPKPGGGQKSECMHRLVLSWKLGRDIAPGMVPDHDDGDGLNNTRANLFEVTERANRENRHEVKTSQFLGVSWDKASGKWRAQIKVPGKKLNLGRYDTELEAIMAREVYVSAHPELGASTIFTTNRPVPAALRPTM